MTESTASTANTLWMGRESASPGELSRASGVLLHPTSLPGPYGIGSLGEHAKRFVDFLLAARQTFWQILPLGPTGFGDSPYSTFSSMAGNPLLIDLDELIELGDLDPADLATCPGFPPGMVDFHALIQWKFPLLERAARRFLRTSSGTRKSEFEDFCTAQGSWINDYTLFMAIKEHFDRQAEAAGHWGATWNRYWDRDIALRESGALKRWRGKVGEKADTRRVWQFYFFRQWSALKRYANQRGILIVGDMPLFVALDSADVWVAPELFCLDEDARETFVAGVPPDYFSSTGQRWGNPLYNWDALAATDFLWWKSRFASLLKMVDVIRIDHFRGLEACWAIPAAEKTAVQGSWRKVPGFEMLESLKKTFGTLPILAEDLGVITPAVDALRDHFGFPGMRLLQFGLGNIEPRNVHLPENYVENSVVYTGTHDNDTSVGWYRGLSDPKKAAVAKYVGHPLADPAWELMRIAMESKSAAAIIPMQDILRLDSWARMNTPATASGNWCWRLQPGYDGAELARGLGELTEQGRRQAKA